MNLNFLRVKDFLSYYFRAKGKYKIQSPLAFRISRDLLEERKRYYIFDELEGLRHNLSQNNSLIPVIDLGAGSVKLERKEIRKISEIAKSSLSPRFKCEWLFKLVLIFQPKNVIELGTSLGLSSLYLSAANKQSKLYTVEGSPSIYEIAINNFKIYRADNIKAYLGSFDMILPEILDESIEMVYVDGNHTKEATLRYFSMIINANSTRMVIIFDDIYWSQGMKEAWNEIKKLVPYCIDLYYIGVVVFDERIVQKQEFTIIPYRYKPWQIGLFN